MPEMKKAVLPTEKSHKAALKTIEHIREKEGGWPSCKVFNGNFYTRPLWIAEWLVESTKNASGALQRFDHKIMDDKRFVPTRIYIPPKDYILKPEDRFDPYRVHYSYTNLDWMRNILSDDEQARRNKARYRRPDCPNLEYEWDRIIHHAFSQAAVNKTDYKFNQAESTLLSFYRFVKPEVFMSEAVSPNPNAIFQLYFSATNRRHQYTCYAGGVSKANVDDWTSDCIKTY